MITKEIFVDGEYDHTLTVEKQKNKTVYTLYYSQGKQWASDFRGTIALKVVEDGNGLKIVGKKNGKLDYSEAMYLSIILRFFHNEYKFEQATKDEF